MCGYKDCLVCFAAPLRFDFTCISRVAFAESALHLFVLLREMSSRKRGGSRSSAPHVAQAAPGAASPSLHSPLVDDRLSWLSNKPGTGELWLAGSWSSKGRPRPSHAASSS